MQPKTKSLVMTALMAAVLCILAPISIPVTNVPISMATFVVYLCGLILGWKYGTLSVLIYLLLGMVGLPVFAGYKSSIAVLAGPTGGYLIGYLAIAVCCGISVKWGKGKRVIMVAGMFLGTAVCYTIGTIWLAMQLHLSAKAALMAGVIPFIPGDLIKMALCVIAAPAIRQQLQNAHLDPIGLLNAKEK